MQKVSSSLVAAVGGLPIVTSGIVSADGEARFRPGADNIVTIASENGTFTALVEVLTCTGLVAAVANSDFRFTVFAPTDEAFQNEAEKGGKRSPERGKRCRIYFLASPL